jgi:TRAP-type C4-dicarboxylate transport system permease small subunit
MHNAVDGLMRIVKAVAATCFAAMILMTLIQVINRYAFSLPLFWTEEFIVLLLVWSMLLGMPVQLWSHEEIVVDVMPTTSPAMEQVKHYLTMACSVAFCVVLAWAGWAYAQRGIPVHSPALGLSRFWFFVPIPAAAALSVIALLLRPRAPSTGGFE